MLAQTVIPVGAQIYNSGETVKLQAVYGGTTNAEDNSYASATPSGSMELQITNVDAHGFFKPGKKYYVNITEAVD